MIELSNSNANKIVLIVFSVCLLFSIVFFGGRCEYFAFNQVAPLIKYDQIGHITIVDELYSTDNVPFPGYYAYGMIISALTSIPYAHLPFQFFQFIPLVCIFYALLLRVSRDKVISSITTLLLIISSFGVTALFWPHGVGLILFMLSGLIILHCLDDRNNKLYLILLVIVIIATQYISYKAMAWTFGLILFSLVYICTSKILGISKVGKSSKVYLLYLVIISAIFVFSLNGFYYETLGTIIRYGDIFLGFEDLLLKFNKSSAGILTDYNVLYYNPITSYLSYLKVTIIVILIVWGALIFIKDLQDRGLNTIHYLFSAFVFVSIINIIVYALRGLFDPSFLLYAGLIAVILINQTKKYILLKYLLLGIFVVTCLVSQVYSVENEQLPSDDNYFSYMTFDSGWVIKHAENTMIKSDALTRGYYLYQLLKEDDLYSLGSLGYMNEDDLRAIIDYREYLFTKEKCIYILNYKEKVLSIGWKYLKGFNYISQRVDDNKGLNEIYTSGFVKVFEKTSF